MNQNDALEDRLKQLYSTTVGQPVHPLNGTRPLGQSLFESEYQAARAAAQISGMSFPMDVAGQPAAWTSNDRPVLRLRHALAECSRLRGLLAEYGQHGLPAPPALADEFAEAGRQVRALAAEDRQARLRAARAEVELHISREERLIEAQERLRELEKEIREAEGK